MKKKQQRVELNERAVQRLAKDALILAAATMLYVPLTQPRAHRAAGRVGKLLLPRPTPQEPPR